MSTTIDFVTVTNSIAALSISGVSVRDIDEVIPANVMKPATLQPVMDEFISDLTVTPAEVSCQNLDVTYRLRYQYIHCAVGGSMNLTTAYSGMITNLALILKAFADHTALGGAMVAGTPVLGAIGTVTDGAGNYYYGCDVLINILQFLEV